MGGCETFGADLHPLPPQRPALRIPHGAIVFTQGASFEFEGTVFEDAFRPDLIVNDAVIVEIEAARAVDPVFERQLLTYLRILNLRLGLLMIFGMTTMMAGIRRVAS